jgi:uncharacterized membrane protein
MLVFCLVHTVILLFIFQNELFYGKLSILRADLNTEYDYATRIVQGCNPFPYNDWEYGDSSLLVRHCLPYRDFSVEYPPLMMFFITLPRLMVPYFYLYWQAYALEVLFFDLLGMFLLTSLSRELGHSPWKTLGIYTIALFAIGPLVVTRFDFIPAILTLISIFFFVKRKSKTAWAFLAIATLTKIYPLVIAPIFFLMQFNRKQKKELLGGLAAFVITVAVIVIPCILLSPSGFWNSFSYHAQRPLQIESTYASIIELLSAFKLFSVDYTTSFGSTNLAGHVSDILAKLSFGVMVLSLLVIYWSVYHHLKKGQIIGQHSKIHADEVAFAIKYSLIAVLVFILTCKVFSPQYMIWLLPLIPLLTQKSKNVIWLLFVVAAIMTFFIFPQYYDRLRGGSLIIIATLVIRNVTLFGILLLLIRGSFLKAVTPERPYYKTAL